MRPSANSTTSSGIGDWKSPMPYLFGGLALMLGLVSVALLILACSFHKTPSSTSSAGGDDGEQEKPTRPVGMEAADSEPKVVVIMAGEKLPTYLAKPMCSTTSHQTGQNVSKSLVSAGTN